MSTLVLRNVPDEVIERLERLAAREQLTVQAVAVRELVEASRRGDNPLLLAELPDLSVNASTIVEDLHVERGER
ncbi:antitoxin [Skermania sp. ID1734]|uniref:antitoxin n=1 Tax=Skermania sp. ID1734 TaxID=2597516 RepID=UPI00117BFF21|nr:antitoxin [Skermania sp. ID1734]TSE00152.1 antitoxin [Skermania sp. ID1734]